MISLFSPFSSAKPWKTVFDPSRARKGNLESVSRKPSRVAILRVAPGTRPVFLPRARTSSLLAVLHLDICLRDAPDSHRITWCSRGRAPHSLGTGDTGNDAGPRACLRETFREEGGARKRAQVKLFTGMRNRLLYFLLHQTMVTPMQTTAIPTQRFRLMRSPRKALAPKAPAA